MKRSEAVQLLENLIYLNQEFDKIDCDKVLKGLEDAGMLPPIAIVPVFGTVDNFWEPET